MFSIHLISKLAQFETKQSWRRPIIEISAVTSKWMKSSTKMYRESRFSDQSSDTLFLVWKASAFETKNSQTAANRRNTRARRVFMKSNGIKCIREVVFRSKFSIHFYFKAGAFEVKQSNDVDNREMNPVSSAVLSSVAEKNVSRAVSIKKFSIPFSFKS
jgi:hypothetical protein